MDELNECIGLIGYLKLEDEAPFGSSYRHIDLKTVSASITIRGFVANLVVDVTFKNQTSYPLEAVYICPVDAKAALYEFQATLNDRTITAQCLKKQKAEMIYKEALEEGKTAIMAECKSDLLQFALGNMPPGEVAKIRLKLVMELSVETDGALSFVLPTVFNPRYGTPAPSTSPFKTPGVLMTSSKYTIDIEAIIYGCHPIEKITSHSDSINVSIEEDGMTAKVRQDGVFTCDRDWGLQIYYRSPHRPQLVIETGDRSSTGLMKSDVLMANFFPELPVDAFSPHHELIFVIDRSGSMQGDKIEKVKMSLLLFLRSLPHGCRFNIVSFGSSCSHLFENGSERYSEESLKKALCQQENMKADMGGTEIYRALKSVYSIEPIPGYPRQIIILTDGQVWNVDQVLELISRHSHETRVFSIGIGDGASTALVKGMAECGGGRSEMVYTNDQIYTKVMGLVASMLQKSIYNVNIECNIEPKQDVELVPRIPPIIYGGQHLIIYARMLPKSQMKKFKLTGQVNETTITCEASEEDLKVVHDTNLSIHRLAAKAQIARWQNDDSKGDDKTDEIISLSESSNVICSQTAMVAVDQDGKIVRCKAPSGRNSVDQSSSFPSMPLACDQTNFRRARHVSQFLSMPLKSNLSKPKVKLCSVTNQSEAHQSFFASLESQPQIPKSQQGPNFGFGSQGSQPDTPTSEPCLMYACSAMSPSSPNYSPDEDESIENPLKDASNESQMSLSSDAVFFKLISLQNFDGSWHLKSIETFQQLKKLSFNKVIKMDDILLATMIALACFQVWFPDRKSEWVFVSLKGESFLTAGSTTWQDHLEEVKKLLPPLHQCTAN